MSKRKTLLKGYVLIFLVLILYITVTVPFKKTVIFWIAFGFSVPAFLAQIYTLHTIVRQEIAMKDRTLDFPKLRISILYLIIQLAVSLLLMNFAGRIAVWAAAAAEVAVLLLAVVGFFAVEAACAEVNRQNEQMSGKTAQMQLIKEQIDRLILHSDEEGIKKRLLRLAEELKYSTPVSADSTQETEDDMVSVLAQIEEGTLAGDADTVFVLCDRMTGLLKERERIFKNRR